MAASIILIYHDFCNEQLYKLIYFLDAGCWNSSQYFKITLQLATMRHKKSFQVIVHS